MCADRRWRRPSGVHIAGLHPLSLLSLFRNLTWRGKSFFTFLFFIFFLFYFIFPVLPLCVVQQSGGGPPCPIRKRARGDVKGEARRCIFSSMLFYFFFFFNSLCVYHPPNPPLSPLSLLSQRPFCVPVGKLEAISP